MKKFIPRKNYVLVKFIKKDEADEKKTKSGIVLPYEQDQSEKGVSPGKYNFVVDSVGPEVEEVKVGQMVIFNEFDMKGLQNEDEEMFALMKEDSIMALYE